jgi:hypothetical protein
LTDAFSADFLVHLGHSYRSPYSGAHLIVHNLEGETCRVEHALTSGIHALKNGSIEKVRIGGTCRDVRSPRELCVLGNLPLSGTKIHPEARLAMIHAGGRVLDSDLKQLKPSVAAFVNGLQQEFRMISLAGGSG